MLQLLNFFLIEPLKGLLVRAEFVELETNVFGGSGGPLVLECCPNASRCHETICQEEEPLGTSQHLGERDSGAVNPLGIPEVRASVRIVDFDLISVVGRSLDI